MLAGQTGGERREDERVERIEAVIAPHDRMHDGERWTCPKRGIVEKT